MSRFGLIWKSWITGAMGAEDLRYATATDSEVATLKRCNHQLAAMLDMPAH